MKWALGLIALTAALLPFLLRDSAPTKVEPVRLSNVPRDNVTVRAVTVKSVGGKYRYFLDVRNMGAAPFTGDVKIELRSSESSLGLLDFTPAHPLDPGIGASVFKDLNTGPVSVHGRGGGISRFTFSTSGGSSGGDRVPSEIHN